MAASSLGVKNPGTKILVRAVAAGALGLAILAAGTPGSARAEDDDKDNSPSIWNLDTRLWNGFMSAMGLQSGTEVGIDYRERSPLVVPPERSLPAPQSAPPRNAAWPIDPEAKRRQEAADKKKTRSVRGYDPDYESRNLNPSEIGPRGGARTSSASANAPTRPTGEALTPSELGGFGSLFSFHGWGWASNKDEIGTFTAEPPRTSLVAPPTGYQTPSPEQPYGNTKRIEPFKPVKPMEEVR
jgi:type IV secretory pathway VirB10-like protein